MAKFGQIDGAKLYITAFEFIHNLTYLHYFECVLINTLQWFNRLDLDYIQGETVTIYADFSALKDQNQNDNCLFCLPKVI